MSDAAAETVFFDDRGVLVTNARFVIPDGTTLAVSNITSVRTIVERATFPEALLAMAFGFGLILFHAVWIGCAAFAFGAYRLIASIAARAKIDVKYYVVVGTPHGEQKALWAPEQPFIQSVAAALNKAIIHRP